jgi:hypothetical protein
MYKYLYGLLEKPIGETQRREEKRREKKRRSERAHKREPTLFTPYLFALIRISPIGL